MDPRRHLDGDSILQSIEDFGNVQVNAVRDLFAPTTADDIASGAVDHKSLSRTDKAALAIDGEAPSAFSALNPWNVGKDFSPSVTAQCGAEGGAVLVLHGTTPSLNALARKLIAPRFAFLWDDTIKAGDAGTLDVAVVGDSILVAQIGPPQGSQLTLWCTDSDIAWTLVKQGAPSEAAALTKEAFAATRAQGGADPGLFGNIADGVKSFFQAQTELAVGGVVVVAVVLYLIFKGD